MQTLKKEHAALQGECRALSGKMQLLQASQVFDELHLLVLTILCHMYYTICTILDYTICTILYCTICTILD